MTFLYEKYPETVTVAGEEYPILTDFRNWIKFADLIADTEVEDEEKAELLLCWFKDRVPDDLQAALDALADFYVMESDAGETEGEEEQKPPVFSFSTDADYFVAAYQECYGISLKEIPYLHWYEFIALFKGLPADCELKQRMRIRGMNPMEISDSRERARIRKIQKMLALPAKEMSDEEIGDAFSSFFGG